MSAGKPEVAQVVCLWILQTLFDQELQGRKHSSQTSAVRLHPRCALVEDAYRQKPALVLRTACSCVAWGETAGLSAKSMTLTFCCPGLDLLFAMCPLVPVTNKTS